jgi:site-specific recombinase XerC
MFNEVKVILSEDLSKRGYVTFYIQGKRYREYSGNKLNLDITPNEFKTYKQRLVNLKKLAFEFSKAIESGWIPPELIVKDKEQFPTLQVALKEILDEKQSSSLSKLYKRDLSTIYNTLLEYFPEDILNTEVIKLKEINIEGFLNQYKSSGTYYMSKRKTTSVFFSELVRKKLLSENPIKDTRPMKRVAKLHQVYDKKQLMKVLEFLEKEYPNLHLCCLLTYGCFLRPHQEIRLLKKKHINEDITKIVLSASENKSRRVRTSIIPEYVKEILKLRLKEVVDPEFNIISKQSNHYNESYINTQWSRAKKRMIELDILEKGHTIYSFRHTAAVNVYRKTKDLHILQQLLQHSNMIVTLNYLRGLGEVNDDGLRDVLPEL